MKYRIYLIDEFGTCIRTRILQEDEVLEELPKFAERCKEFIDLKNHRYQIDIRKAVSQ